MNHEREFSPPPVKRTMTAEDTRTAVAYALTFSTEHGKRVLDDLRKKFNPRRPRFPRNDRPNAVTAAIIDGEANVLLEIEDAIIVGTPLALQKTTP